jgi:DNA polymerase-1
MTATSPSGTLYLVDLYAQVFRSFYAVRTPMTSPVTGEGTQVIYGVLSSLFKLIQQAKPKFLAFCIDLPGDTFRDVVYDEYKATRPPAPDDIKKQAPRLMEVLRALGIPVIGAPGLEADDVIATIVQRVLDDGDLAGIDVRIVSKDKDLEQLLGDRVTMFDDSKDVVITAETLLADKGVTPSQVVDLLTLMGDTSDNVPGAVGIGPKTAALLLQEFGTLDGIYANIDKIKGKRRENLEAFGAPTPVGGFPSQRDLSKFLVTLKRDGEFDFAIDDATIGVPDLDDALTLFRELGFNRFQAEAKRLASMYGGAVATTGAPSEPGTGAWPAPVVTADSGPAPDRGEPDTILTAGARYECVRTVAELQAAVAAMREAPLVSVDTETTGLTRTDRLVGVCLAWRDGHGVYVPVRSPASATHLDEATALDLLKPVLEDPAVKKCGHNIKFDAAVLLRCGVRLDGVIFDTMLAGQFLDAGQRGSYKMDDMAVRWLNYRPVPISELIDLEEAKPRRARQAALAISDVPTVIPSRPTSMDQVPLAQVTDYAAEDADITLRLAKVLVPEIEKAGMADDMRDVEAPLTVVLAAMEEAGVLCDADELSGQASELVARVNVVRESIFSTVGEPFVLDSPKQLGDVLFDKLALVVGGRGARRTSTGSRSTDSEVLDKLVEQEDPADPRTLVPGMVLEYRKLQKLVSTYLDALRAAIDPADGRIHTTYRQAGAATGRLASDSPNLQNIPVRSEEGRQVRKAFHAPPGHVLLCADYSQIELRVLAHLSEDPGLLDAFGRGLDIHAAVAAQVFGGEPQSVTRDQRGQAKTINFGIIYGISAWGLARRVGDLSYEGAVALIADYKRRFPGIDRFLQACIRQATEHGYVTTILGRRRAIPEINHVNGNVRGLGERLAINSVIQGSAADLIKLAMVNLHRRIIADRLPMRLLLQIHDELVLEVPEGDADAMATVVREEMERAMRLRVPLVAEVGVGVNWMAAK